MKKLNNIFTLLGVIATNSAFAVTDAELFEEVEKKGNVLIEFLTSGWFAFGITSVALIYVIVAVLQGKMELIRGFIIIGACFVLSSVPKIAQWIVG